MLSSISFKVCFTTFSSILRWIKKFQISILHFGYLGCLYLLLTRKLVWFADNGIFEGGCMIYTSGFAYVTYKCSHFCPLLLGFHAELFGCLHLNKQFAVVEHLGF
ncbi:hypothetical protein Patl1_24550 [Pistacia atlantica]|uniref:Uncharacterized protein n=1 Tax=Pistacia atlantica TaxID=434234 RepID=A0ACC1A0D1_9ROSI|nr:hypothetical protein Patl1_24550 [Pistacia atlantica]